MTIHQTNIDGLTRINIDPKNYNNDYRGYNVQMFDIDQYKQIGQFVQDAFSISYKNTFRGLHGCAYIDKLIYCSYGTLFLIVIDFRKQSKTYLQTFTITLDSPETQIFIPKGCVNGHYCLSDMCMFNYKKTHKYMGQIQKVVNILDPIVPKFKHIDYENLIMSSRDRNAQILKESQRYIF